MSTNQTKQSAAYRKNVQNRIKAHGEAIGLDDATIKRDMESIPAWVISYLDLHKRRLDELNTRLNRLEILISGIPNGQQAVLYIAQNLAQMFESIQEGAAQKSDTQTKGLILPGGK